MDFVKVHGVTFDVDFKDGLDLSKKKITDITEIKGLEQLTKFWILELYDNPIQFDERDLLKKKPQEVVRYCRRKASKAKNGS